MSASFVSIFRSQRKYISAVRFPHLFSSHPCVYTCKKLESYFICPPFSTDWLVFLLYNTHIPPSENFAFDGEVEIQLPSSPADTFDHSVFYFGEYYERLQEERERRGRVISEAEQDPPFIYAHCLCEYPVLQTLFDIEDSVDPDLAPSLCTDRQLHISYNFGFRGRPKKINFHKFFSYDYLTTGYEKFVAHMALEKPLLMTFMFEGERGFLKVVRAL